VVGRYADPSDASDLTRIETSFHEWIRGNLLRMDLVRPGDFAAFVTGESAPLAEAYCTLFRAAQSPDSNTDLHSLFFNNGNGIRNQFQLIFAAVRRGDSPGQIRARARRVADYLDLLYVHRIISGHAAHPSELDIVIRDLIPSCATPVTWKRSPACWALSCQPTSGGEPFTSLSSAAACARRTKSANGWEFWQLQTRRERRPLRELRDELIRGER